MKYGPNADSDNVKKWDGLKRAYYVAMGWDEETAIPLKETLDELDLPDVKQALYGLIARAELKSPKRTMKGLLTENIAVFERSSFV